MAEDTEHQQNESPVPPTSTQNLIIGIIMGAVVLLLLLLVINQQFNKNGRSSDNPEVVELRKQIKEQQTRQESLRLTGLPGVTQNPEALVSQIKSDTEALARLVNANASEAASLQSTRERAATLDRRVIDLEEQVRQYSAAARRVSQLEADLKAARQESAATVNRTELDRLQSEFDLAKAQSDGLQAELTQLRGQNQNMIDANTYAILKTQRDDLTADNALLRAENQRLIADLVGAKLFVTQAGLSPRAVALYQALKEVESESHLVRRETYTTFNEKIKANVREEISFTTGSAQIARQHEAHIEEVVKKAPETSFFLVVGYASTSGDSKKNEELSSQRATRVAAIINYRKKKGQAVQAVYLGEGKRFGPEDSPNQVCEIWEIRP
ncbi:MAG: outer membrane protein OmpA-like peptidoglycan-associated protein [Akkermansiaceae bacterium]|jgi:outer membrane protein OmpA-like peptidoglycan-associated protein